MCEANRPADADSDRPPCLLEVEAFDLEALRWFEYLHKPGMGGPDRIYNDATGLDIPDIYHTLFGWTRVMIADYLEKTRPNKEKR